MSSADPDSLLSRELGVRELAVGIFNYIVGSGIFVLPAVAVAQLGPAAPLAYLSCTVVMGLVVLCFAEAGSRVVTTGGPYAYVEVALGPAFGLVAGVLLWAADVTATAAVGTVFAGSVASLTGSSPPAWLAPALVVAVFAVLAGINVRGVRSGAVALEIVTVAKLLPLLIFVVAGAFFVNPAHLAWGPLPDFPAVLRATGILVFAFAGIEGALTPSGEVRDPVRTVPRAALIALAAVTFLYLAIQTVALGILGPDLATDRVTPLATAAARFAGAPGRALMILGATISMLGYLTVAVLATPRCLYAFGRDGILPRALAAVHPRYRTPHVAILVHSLVAATLAVTGTFERLAILANASILALYFLCAVAAFLLRRRDVRASGEPFRTPGGPLVPVLTCAAILWVLSETVTGREIAAVAATVLVALALHGVRAWRKAGA